MRLWVPEWLLDSNQSKLYYRFPSQHLWGYCTNSMSQASDSPGLRRWQTSATVLFWIHCICCFITSLCLFFQAASSNSRVLDCPWHPGAHDDLHHQYLRMSHKAFIVCTILYSPRNLILQNLNWENALRNHLEDAWIMLWLLTWGFER